MPDEAITQEYFSLKNMWGRPITLVKEEDPSLAYNNMTSYKPYQSSIDITMSTMRLAQLERAKA